MVTHLENWSFGHPRSCTLLWAQKVLVADIHQQLLMEDMAIMLSEEGADPNADDHKFLPMS
jgi:hypothetical protein